MSVDVEVAVRRGEKGLGIVVSELNEIQQLAVGGTAEADKKLLTGDVVISVDGYPLKDTYDNLLALKDVLPNMARKPVHMFTVRRSRSRLNNMMDKVNARMDAGASAMRSVPSCSSYMASREPPASLPSAATPQVAPASFDSRGALGGLTLAEALGTPPQQCPWHLASGPHDPLEPLFERSLFPPRSGLASLPQTRAHWPR